MMRIFGLLVQHIAIGNLGAEEDGKDETDSRDDGENDDVLVASPGKGVIGPRTV